MNTRRVHKRHLTHTQDTHLLSVSAHTLANLVELIRDTKEVRTINLIHLGKWRDMQHLQVIAMQTDIGLLCRVDLIGEGANHRSLVGAFQEQYHCQQQAHLDGDSQVEDNRQDKGHQHHNKIGLWSLGQTYHRIQAQHIIAHDYQHTCQTSHWYHTHQRTKAEQHQQQHQCMHDTRHWSTTTVVDIRHRSGNRARSGDTAKEWCHHVSHTLRNQFGV